jgi:hypothetical protein
MAATAAPGHHRTAAPPRAPNGAQPRSMPIWPPHIHEHEDKDDAITLPERRHEKVNDLSDKLILWLRFH